MTRTRTALQCLLLLAACTIFQGRASAVAVCDFTSVSGDAFGTFDPISGTVKDTLGTIFVTCTGSVGDVVSYTIALSAGSGNILSRSMQGISSTMNYNLFMDAGHTVIWGDGSSGTLPVSDGYTLSSTSATKSYTVFGEIPAQTSPTTGSYLDNLVITLTY